MGTFLSSNKTRIYFILFVIFLMVVVVYFSIQGHTKHDETPITSLYAADIKECTDELSKFYPVKDVIIYGEVDRVRSKFNVLPILKNSTLVQFYVINKSSEIYNVPFGSKNLYFFWNDEGFEGCSYHEYSNNKKILRWETECNGFNLTMEIKDDGKYIFVGNELVDENGIYRRFSLVNKMFVNKKEIFDYFIEFMKKNNCTNIYI